MNDSSIIYRNLTRKKRQSTIKSGTKNGELIKSFSLPPIILGQEYLRQQIEEKTDGYGNRKITTRMQNQQGKTLFE